MPAVSTLRDVELILLRELQEIVQQNVAPDTKDGVRLSEIKTTLHVLRHTFPDDMK